MNLNGSKSLSKFNCKPIENKLIEYEHYLDKIEKEHAQNKRKEEELEIKVHKRRKAMTAAGTDLSEESYLPMDYYSDSEVGKIEDQNLAITKEINRL